MFPAAQARDNLNHVVSGLRPALHPGSTSRSTHASNETYQIAMSDGFGFPAPSRRANRFCKARMPAIVVIAAEALAQVKGHIRRIGTNRQRFGHGCWCDGFRFGSDHWCWHRHRSAGR